MLGQLKRNDTNYTLYYTILNDDGSVVNLTGASVVFVMGKKNQLITNSPATVINNATGEVKYDLKDVDTLLAGTFLGEFRVTFDTGKAKTYPSNGYITVNITPNLNNGAGNIIIDDIAAKQGDFENKLDNILKLTGDGNPEIVDSRDGYLTLASRLNDMTNTGKYQVSVMDKKFDAKGDDFANDTNAFQAALNLAKLKVLNNGIEIRIPAGRYRLTSRLIIYKNTTLTLDSNAVLVRNHSSGFFVNGESTDSFSGYNGNGNIIIQGGMLDGNIIQQNSPYTAMALGRAKGLIIRDLEIKDVRSAHAMDIAACKDVIIERCRFRGFDPNTQDGDNASNYREAIQIGTHTAEGFTHFGEFDGTPTENVTIRDCYFGASENLPAWATGIGNHGHTAGKWCKNIHIYGNLFEGCTWAGIRPYKFSDIKMHHNHFSNCSYGVRFSNYDGLGSYGTTPESGENIEISDNTFVNTAVRDIYIAAWEKGGYVAWCKNIKILDNISEGNVNTQTIYLSFCDDVQIRGNLVDGSYRFVYAEYCRDVHVFGNDTNNVTTEFMYVAEPDAPLQNLGYTKDLFVNHNELRNTARTGIYFACAVDGFEMLYNYIKDVATETTNTRNAIYCSSGAKNGRIMGNKVRGTKHKYGVECTSGCSNIQTYNNDTTGALTKPQFNNSIGGFDGYYMHSPNGNRYKVTINDTGVVTATIG